MKGRKPVTANGKGIGSTSTLGKTGGFTPIDKEPPTPLDGVALDRWRSIVESHGDAFRDVDATALCLYCQLWGSHVRLSEQLAREGYTLSGKAGKIYKHPSANSLTQVDGLLIRAADALGLSPASKSRLKVQPKPDPNSILRLIRAK